MTMLWKVKMDFLNAIDNRNVVCLVLLDFSAMFNMVNRSLLLSRLKYRFVVDGNVLNWLHNYITYRSQKVVINADQGYAESDPITLSCGVPQGSVLGHILFTLYISSLGDICRKHNVEYHGYADDHQEYLSFIPTDIITKNNALKI